MRTLEEALDQFVYHPATPETALQHAHVRELFVAMVHGLWLEVPDGPEKTLALRKLQESAMYANLAVALQAPSDTSDTRSVARVLPLADPKSFGFHPAVDLGPCINDAADISATEPLGEGCHECDCQ